MTVDWKSERLKPEGPSAKVLYDQLMNKIKEIEVVRAQLVAMKAKRVKDDHAELNLLERVAYALMEAAQAAQAQQSVPLDPAGHHSPHPDDRAIPGSSTKAARRARYSLESGLEQVLDRWETSKAADFHPTSTKGPSTRCRKRACPKYGKRVAAWDHRGTNEFCTGCGDRLPAPEAAA